MKEKDFPIYLSPSEHDDRLHMNPNKEKTVWGLLDEAADCLHSKIFPSLESDSSRKYVIDSVYTLDYTLKKYPEDTIRVKALLDKDQLTISGSYIDYSDNQHEQETLVRLVTCAKWYLRKHFGYETRFVKRTDSLSLTPQIGQIYNKAGVELFINHRHAYLSPSYFWYWVGLDGTKTLTLQPHYNYGDYSNSIYEANKKGLDSYSTYTPEASTYGHKMLDGLSEENWPSRIAWIQVGNDNTLPVLSIENIQKFIEGWNAEPKQDKPMRMSNLEDFQAEIKKRVASGLIKPENWTKWGMCFGIREDDDSLPIIRILNESRRKTLDLEKLSCFCDILGLSKYPAQEIQEYWGKILFPRDHSNSTYLYNLGNTSFSDAVVETKPKIESLTAGKLTELADAVDYQRCGTPIFIFNTLNWSRTESVELQMILPTGGYRAVDYKGLEVPLQVVSSEEKGEGKTSYKFLLMAENVPSVGYKVFYVMPGVASKQTDLSSEDGVIENKYYRIVVDADGFKSIYDKELKREIIDRNRTSTYRKTQKGETVNFGEVISSRFFDGQVRNFLPLNYLKEGSLISRMKVDNYEVVENGPVRAAIKINGHLETEGIVVTVSLFKDLKRIGLKYEVVRSGEMLDGNKDGEPDYVSIPLPFKMSDNMKQQFGIVYGSIDNPVLADVAEGLDGGPSGIQWPTQPAAPGKIINGGFSKHQKTQAVKAHIAYRFNRHSDKKHVHEWTDVREADGSWGVTIAHPGVIQYERLNFVAPVLCAWEPGLRAWGKNYERESQRPGRAGEPLVFARSVPGEDYTVDLLLRSHKESWDASESYKLGSEKNYPLLVGYPKRTSGGKLSEEASFLALTPRNAVLTAFKKAEDNSGYVARFYEASDIDSEVTLTFNPMWKIGSATQVNLMEDETKTLKIHKNAVSINTLGFGIETLKFNIRS